MRKRRENERIKKKAYQQLWHNIARTKTETKPNGMQEQQQQQHQQPEERCRSQFKVDRKCPQLENVYNMEKGTQRAHTFVPLKLEFALKLSHKSFGQHRQNTHRLHASTSDE